MPACACPAHPPDPHHPAPPHRPTRPARRAPPLTRPAHSSSEAPPGRLRSAFSSGPSNAAPP
eukprot:8444991-Alexandrium_andersonii.AAC.1